MGRNESPLLQNLLSHHHSKIIDGSHAKEGLQSPRCRPTQPLFRPTTFLLNLNMSFATYTKNITKLNNIQRIAHKHTPNTSQLHTSHTQRNLTGTRLKPGQNPLSPRPRRHNHPRIAPSSPPNPCPYHPVPMPVSSCECLHSHTGSCRLVNYPVKTKGSKQTSRRSALTRVPTRAPTRVPTGVWE